jgi:hypothetical protein
MKAVVLLSKTFFPKHPKAGEETGFRNKILMSIGDIEFACDCGWTGLRGELSFHSIDNGYDSAGMPVYVNDSRCPSCGGYATDDGVWKIHTIRANYEYWVKKIARLKEAGGVLSVRQWSNAPYRINDYLK